MADEQSNMCLWENLKPTLRSESLSTLRDIGFTHMTPVQSATIPLLTTNKDVAVEAVTGSGKTLAFVLPILEILSRREEKWKKHEVGAVIISPTRELAIQINELLEQFTKEDQSLKQLLLVGGSDPALDGIKFKENGGNILIGTPGRLEDLFKKSKDGLQLASHVKSLEVLVLDEADRLLEMGFQSSINAILGYLPKQRRTGLFSATQTDQVEDLVRAGLRNPVRVCVKEKSTHSKKEQRTPLSLKNFYMVCEADAKFSHLVAFLREHKDYKNLVFFSTCACVEYFSKLLSSFVGEVDVLSIHGKMKKKRSKLFDSFKKMKSGILVCTDVMARGVDIPDVDWVLQFDPPSNANAFVHRCGRTARQGNTGNAIIFLLPLEDSYVDFIKINQKAPLQKYTPSENVHNLSLKIQKKASKDRDIYEKGKKAFVSFIQSYSKHECSLIFRFKDLDICKLATGFGLLELPKMPELKGIKDVANFKSIEVDVSSIPYKDKQREKQRKIQIEKNKNNPEVNTYKPRQAKTEAWSQQKEKKLKKEKRRAKKEIVKKRKFEFDDNDLEELAKETRLAKKLKAGKISQEDFNDKVEDELLVNEGS